MCSEACVCGFILTLDGCSALVGQRDVARIRCIFNEPTLLINANYPASIQSNSHFNTTDNNVHTYSPPLRLAYSQWIAVVFMILPWISLNANSQELDASSDIHTSKLFPVFPRIAIRAEHKKQYDFLLSTSFRVVYDLDFYRELVKNNDGLEKGKFRICNSEIFYAKGLSTDMHDFRFALPEKMRGILGTAFLENEDIIVDKANDVAIATNFSQHPELLANMIAVDVTYDPPKVRDGKLIMTDPAISIEMGEGITVKTTFDFLGDFGSIYVDRETFAKLIEKEAFVKTMNGQYVNSAGQLQKGKYGRLKSVKIGTITLENIFCAEDVANSIDTSLLQRFKFGLSLRERKLYLQLQKDIRWDHGDYDGMLVKYFGSKNNMRVFHLEPESIAVQAGVEIDDIITEVDGINTERTGEATEALILRDKPISIKIRRNFEDKLLQLAATPKSSDK